MEEKKVANLLTANAALLYFKKYLNSKKEKIREVIELNNNKHFFIRCLPEFEKEKRYYVLFKQDFFKTFSLQFPNFVKEFPQFDGVGESINKEWLELALSYCELTKANKFEGTETIDVKLFFIYPDGSMFWEDPRAFHKFAETKGLVRVQDKHNAISKKDYTEDYVNIQEMTYCRPLKLMKQVSFITADSVDRADVLVKPQTKIKRFDNGTGITTGD